VQTKPDSALVNVGFTTNAKTLAEAQEKANLTINRVVEETKKLGVSQEDIKTVNYSVSPLYGQAANGPTGITKPMVINSDPKETTINSKEITTPYAEPMPIIPPTAPGIVAYNVTTNIEVKIRDLSKVNSVIDTATKNGANEIYGVQFTLADKEKAVSEARQKGIDAAKKKAKEIASQTGINLGKIMNIYENEQGNYNYAQTAYMAKEAQTNTQIQPGSTEIVVNVTLNYETK
jgi:uncharacterized protein YggE